jgi:hypothetical protein
VDGGVHGTSELEAPGEDGEEGMVGDGGSDITKKMP